MKEFENPCRISDIQITHIHIHSEKSSQHAPGHADKHCTVEIPLGLKKRAD